MDYLGEAEAMEEAEAMNIDEDSEEVDSDDVIDPTMMLTPAEINKALEIKEAVRVHDANKSNRDDDDDEEEDDGGIRRYGNLGDSLTDFEYVQYALCCGLRGEPMDQILTRMEMMAAFKQEYRILDTPQDGSEIITRLVRDQPGFLLSIAYIPSSKNYLQVIDWARLDAAHSNKTWQNRRTYMGYMYYTQHIKLCHFLAIRSGSSMLVECEGATLAHNYDSDLFSRIQHEVMRWYPTNQRETFLLNSPTVANIVFGLWKKFMTPDQRSAVYLGHRIDGFSDESGRRIDELYKQPTPQIAQQNLLQTCHLLLEHRYQNQQHYKLPPQQQQP